MKKEAKPLKCKGYFKTSRARYRDSEASRPQPSLKLQHGKPAWQARKARASNVQGWYDYLTV